MAAPKSKGGRPRKVPPKPTKEPKRGERMYLVLPDDLHAAITEEAKKLGSQRSAWQHVVISHLRERDTLLAERDKLLERLTDRKPLPPTEP